MADFTEGDTGAVMEVTIRDATSREPINIAGQVIRVRFRVDEGLVTVREAAKINEKRGEVCYLFAGSELTPGILRGEFQSVGANGDVLTQQQPFSLEIGSKFV